MAFLHRQKSGWFPFACHPRGPRPATGPGTQYPVGLPLRKAMEWFWLVKDWQVTFSHSLNEQGENGKFSVNSPIGATSVIKSYQGETSSPRQLVCQTARLGTWEAQGTSLRDDTGEGDSYETTYTLTTTIYIGDKFYRDPVSGLIYPKLLVSGWLDSQRPGAPKVQRDLDASASFIMDGVNVPVRTFWFPDWEPESGWFASGATTIRLKPVYF